MKPKDLYTSRYMFIHRLFFDNRKVIFSYHSLIRADKRKIFISEVRAAIKSGKIKRHGKNYIKFIKKYKNRTVICIGEIIGEQIVIKTIVKK